MLIFSLRFRQIADNLPNEKIISFHVSFYCIIVGTQQQAKKQPYSASIGVISGL